MSIAVSTQKKEAPKAPSGTVFAGNILRRAKEIATENGASFDEDSFRRIMLLKLRDINFGVAGDDTPISLSLAGAWLRACAPIGEAMKEYHEAIRGLVVNYNRLHAGMVDRFSGILGEAATLNALGPALALAEPHSFAAKVASTSPSPSSRPKLFRDDGFKAYRAIWEEFNAWGKTQGRQNLIQTLSSTTAKAPFAQASLEAFEEHMTSVRMRAEERGLNMAVVDGFLTRIREAFKAVTASRGPEQTGPTR